MKRLINDLPVIFRCLVCTTAFSMIYGVIHDQITARICIEYFTLGHPNIINSESPTWQGLFWGIYATLGIGILFGILLYYCLFRGPWPSLEIKKFLPLIFILLLFCSVAAVFGGCIGYYFAKTGIIKSQWSEMLSKYISDRFHAVWFAHISSYITALVGGFTILFITVQKRRKKQE